MKKVYSIYWQFLENIDNPNTAKVTLTKVGQDFSSEKEALQQIEKNNWPEGNYFILPSYYKEQLSSRVINFSSDDVNKEYFSDEEYTEMLKAYKDDEFYGAAAIITDKALKYLKFNEEQCNRWRGIAMDAIVESHLIKILNSLEEVDQKTILKQTLLATIQNYAEAEKQHQDSLNNPPAEEEK